MDEKRGTCALCRRHQPLTFHHLIPKKVHRHTRYKKHFTRQQLNQGIYICRMCHSGLHQLYDEMTLAKELSTLERLREDTAVQKHVNWVRKQKRA
ncbi:MAG: hypothetical protein AAF490_13955 [Chloroflexota bacterium]